MEKKGEELIDPSSVVSRMRTCAVKLDDGDEDLALQKKLGAKCFVSSHVLTGQSTSRDVDTFLLALKP